MRQRAADSRESIQRERTQIVRRSLFGLLVLAILVVVFRPPERAIVVITVVVLPALIGAIRKYRALGKAKQIPQMPQ